MKCSTCNVYLPNETSAQQHYSGAKHKSKVAAEEASMSVALRSVFVTGFPANALSSVDFSDYFTANYGSIKRVVKDPRRGFAMIEFLEADSAAQAIADKKHNINYHVVLVKPHKSAAPATGGKDSNGCPESRSEMPALLKKNHESQQLEHAAQNLKLVSPNVSAQSSSTLVTPDTAKAMEHSGHDVEISPQVCSSFSLKRPRDFTSTPASKKPKINRTQKPELGSADKSSDFLVHDTLLHSNILTPAELYTKWKECGYAFETTSVHLHSQMFFLREHVSLSDSAEREQLKTVCEAELRKIFDDSLKLDFFGSSISGLGFAGCDVDLKLWFGQLQKSSEAKPVSSFLTFARTKTFLLNTAIEEIVRGPESRVTQEEFIQLAPIERLKLVRSALRFLANPVRHQRDSTLAFRDYKIQPSKRCPILKFRFRQFNCDLSVSNLAGLRNTQLFRIFSANDLLVDLLYSFRYWTHVHGLCGSSSKQVFSSYSATLLFITYLQITSILPSIEDMQMNNDDQLVDSAFCDGWNCSFWRCLPVSLEEKLRSIDARSVLQGFFQFCTSNDFGSVVLCPYKGQLLSLEEFRLFSSALGSFEDFKFSKINIQDPFVLSHNTSANVSYKIVSDLVRVSKYFSRIFSTENPVFQRFGLFALFKTVPKKCSRVFGAATTSKGSPQKTEVSLTICVDLNQGLSDNCCAAFIDSVRKCLTSCFLLRLDLESALWDSASSANSAFWKGHFTLIHRVWCGRRLLRRQVKREHPALGLCDLEALVSRQISEKEPHSSKLPTITFSLDLKRLSHELFLLRFYDISIFAEFNAFFAVLKTSLPRLMKHCVTAK